jgi:hypothetical protein
MKEIQRLGTSLGIAPLALCGSGGVVVAADPPTQFPTAWASICGSYPRRWRKVLLHIRQNCLGVAPSCRCLKNFMCSSRSLTPRQGRVLDARVAARLSITDQPGAEKPLERTQNADTGTYGAFFELPGHDLYIVRLIIERPLVEQPVALVSVRRLLDSSESLGFDGRLLDS